MKVTTWAPTADETIARMHRALWEFRVRGVVTNLRFLDQVITHERFAHGAYTTKFIDQTPELFRFPRRRDRATRLLRFVGDVIVNGNPEVTGRARPTRIVEARPPRLPPGAPPAGTKQKLDELGAAGFSRWMLEQPQVLLTDTTFRDAHQSLLATRFRTHDLAAIAPAYARLAPELFSVECWGGATFDVAMRFLRECPWERLIAFREAMPNLLLQMLLRSANAVGYTNYPDNVVRYFVRRRRATASTCSACSTRSTGSRTCASRWTPCSRPAGCAKPRSATPAISAIRARPSTTCSTTSAWRGNWSGPARTSSASRTWRACASRAPRTRWSRR